jgi:hypothetical protein
MRRLMEMILHHRLNLTPLLTHRLQAGQNNGRRPAFLAEHRDGVMSVAIAA